ncbi:MAG: acetamidase/formamidase family protein, partial [Burkholderiales bacterium]
MTRTASALAAMLAAAIPFAALGDTTDVKTQSTVEVKKRGAHCVDDPSCMNRYHYAIKPIGRARPGQMIRYETRDALDSNLNLGSQPKDVLAVDLNLVHPITG